MCTHVITTISLPLSLSIYIYIYIHTHTHMYASEGPPKLSATEPRADLTECSSDRLLRMCKGYARDAGIRSNSQSEAPKTRNLEARTKTQPESVQALRQFPESQGPTTLAKLLKASVSSIQITHYLPLAKPLRSLKLQSMGPIF